MKKLLLFLLMGSIVPQSSYGAYLIHRVRNFFYPAYYQQARTIKLLLIHLIGSDFNETTNQQMENLSFIITQEYQRLSQNNQTIIELHKMTVDIFIDRYIPQSLEKLYAIYHTPAHEQQVTTASVLDSARSLLPYFSSPFSITMAPRGIFAHFTQEKLIQFITRAQPENATTHQSASPFIIIAHYLKAFIYMIQQFYSSRPGDTPYEHTDSYPTPSAPSLSEMPQTAPRPSAPSAYLFTEQRNPDCPICFNSYVSQNDKLFCPFCHQPLCIACWKKCLQDSLMCPNNCFKSNLYTQEEKNFWAQELRNQVNQ